MSASKFLNVKKIIGNADAKAVFNSREMNKFIFILLMVLLKLFIVIPAIAISEYEVFQEGYDLYLSCEPAKASEKFEVFLREFPNSSARDAVLFWLGKALMQMGKLNDSERVFNQIKGDFPNSRFSSQATKELERIKSLLMVSRTNKASKEPGMIDKDILNIKAERDKLKELLEEEKRKIEVCEKRFVDDELNRKRVEEALKEKRVLEGRIKELEDQLKDNVNALRRMEEEKDNLLSELEKNRKEITNLDNLKKDTEVKENLLRDKQSEIAILREEKDSIIKKLTEYENNEKELKKQIDDEKKKAQVLEAELRQTVEECRGIREDRESLKLSLGEKIKEVELLDKKILKLVRREDDLKKEKEFATKEVFDLRKKIEELEDKASASDITKVIDERDRLRLLLNEEKRRYEEANSQIAFFKKREAELLSLNATMKDVMGERLLDLGQRLQICERDLVSLQNEISAKEAASEDFKKSIESMRKEVSRLRKFESEVQKLRGDLDQSRQFAEKVKALESQIEKDKKEGIELKSSLKKKDEEILRLIEEKKSLKRIVTELQDKMRDRSYKTLIIGDERFSPGYISSYMFKSQLIFSRIGVRDIPWRNGDLYEDFISEHILYEEAEKINLKRKDNLKELNKGLILTKEDIEYLDRFNLIKDFLNEELRKMTLERSAEAVVIKYTDDDRYEKAAMVIDIQNEIKAGFSLNEVLKLHPQAEYKKIANSDIKKLFGGLSDQFLDNEVVSTFSKDRFIVLKIRTEPLEYRPFEVYDKDKTKRLKEYISKLISALRSKRDVRFFD